MPKQLLFFLTPPEEAFLRQHVVKHKTYISAVASTVVTNHLKNCELPPINHYVLYRRLRLEFPDQKKLVGLIDWDVALTFEDWCKDQVPRIKRIPMLTFLMRRYLHNTLIKE
jgi:hypothetical protein